MTAHEEKTVAEHLQELRSRVFYSVVSIGAGAIIGYLLNKEILTFLTKPLGKPLYYSSPTGGLDLIITISLLFGVFVASPIVMYHILSFIAPAIPQVTGASIRKFLFFSWILLLWGVAVAYYLSLPAALQFLEGFGGEQVQALITTKDYFSFILAYLGGFALIFQLPVIMLLMHKVIPLTKRTLLKKLPYVILGSFIIAAILTPTSDPINQTFMAIPTILLYIVSIVIISVQKPAYATE